MNGVRSLDALQADALGARFYAVNDRDSGPQGEQRARQFSWDRYHIENYLLEPGYVLRALSELTAADPTLVDASTVKEAMRASARRTINRLVRHQMVVFANDAFSQSLGIGADQTDGPIADAIRPSIDGFVRKVEELSRTALSADALAAREQSLRASFETDLASDDWLEKFRGRDVLKDFVTNHVQGVAYETVRDLILARMKDDGFEPPGMSRIIREIEADPFP